MAGVHGIGAVPNASKRLDAGIQLVDLPAPEQSLKAQLGGLQTGDEIDGQSARTRPSRVVRSRRLPGELKVIAAMLEQPAN